MTSDARLFSTQELVLFQAKLKQSVLGVAKAPLIGVITGAMVLTLAVVGYIEYEIIFRVFEFLSGENDYWSPSIMGLTAAVMILGFHLLASRNPSNFAVRFVHTSVQFLIPLYLLGIGLLIASILDVGSLIEEDVPIVLGQLPDITDTESMESLFSRITDPLAATAFSLGLGGLAVVNIFVAHVLIERISANVQDLSDRLSVAKQAIKDYAIIKRTHKRFGQCLRERADLDLWNDEVIRMTVATTVLQERDEALRPHKDALNDQRLDPGSPFMAQESADPAEIARLIKPLEAITLEDVLMALSSPLRLENTQ